MPSELPPPFPALMEREGKTRKRGTDEGEGDLFVIMDGRGGAVLIRGQILFGASCRYIGHFLTSPSSSSRTLRTNSTPSSSSFSWFVPPVPFRAREKRAFYEGEGGGIMDVSPLPCSSDKYSPIY